MTEKKIEKESLSAKQQNNNQNLICNKNIKKQIEIKKEQKKLNIQYQIRRKDKVNPNIRSRKKVLGKKQRAGEKKKGNIN